MARKLVAFCLGAIFVSMATGAPVSTSDEQAADSAVDRAKRADEQIVFGNHQNQARVLNKRVDLSADDLTPELPVKGELDEGSEATVQKETSVDKDLADRADAARKDFEDQDKIADAMEAAMESVDNAAKNEEQSDEADVPESSDSEQASGEASEPSSDSMSGQRDEAGEESGNVEDEDIKDLLQVTGENEGEEQAAEQTADGVSESEEERQESDGDNQAEQHSQAGASDVGGDDGALQAETQSEDNAQLNDFWREMYQYMDAYPGNPRLPFDLYRGRRSLAGKRAGSRRIKRDLLDDVQYDPDWLRYLYSVAEDEPKAPSDDRFDAPTSGVLDMGDSLISDQDDYVPVTDSDAEELYNELEEYLQWELQRRSGIEKLREALGLVPTEEDIIQQEPVDRGVFYGGESDSADSRAGEGSLLDSQLYPYDPEYPSEGLYAAKRSDAGRDVYGLPIGEADKRYFFPFADEPGTHWGAFVPEKRDLVDAGDERSAFLDDPYLDDYQIPSKRDYNEAIQRLQRLAMALSDNRGPYYAELVQDQPYKK
ncbi:hypothetical protein EGW08_003835 [Elysia chlorotica]|uniref:Uncharacterized protein n=1 Tax=Elysia chlorotica TaxID=188477 RepID=A0A3S1ACJ8_ELYCH|nr:hypothetical protein EGW08_003835 [Elysia chlorotica]